MNQEIIMENVLNQDMRNRLDRYRLAVAILFIVLYFTGILLFWSQTLDDSYIIFRYAQNWILGNGIVYNTGERVEGYTSFLWVALVALLLFFKIEPFVGVKLLGGVFSLLTLRFVFSIAERYYSSVSGWVAVGTLLAYPFFMVASLEGLETPLFTSLLLGIAWVLLCVPLSRPEVPITLGFLLALLSMTRPEGVMFVIPTVIVLWLSAEPAVRMKSVFWLLFVFVVVFGLYFLWRWQYYGLFLPNTFYAKGTAEAYLIARGIRATLSFHVKCVIFLMILALIGTYLSRGVLSTLALWGFILTRIVFVLLSGEAWMGHYRFSTAELPFIAILASIPLTVFWRTKARWLVLSLYLVAFSAGILQIYQVYEKRREYAQGLERAHIRAAKDLKAILPRDSLIACGDAGALAYISGLRNIDILGLNDTHIARLRGRFSDKTDPDYVMHRQPAAVVLLSFTPSSQPFEPRLGSDKLIFNHSQFQQHYILWRTYSFRFDYWLWIYLRKRASTLSAEVETSRRPQEIKKTSGGKRSKHNE